MRKQLTWCPCRRSKKDDELISGCTEDSPQLPPLVSNLIPTVQSVGRIQLATSLRLQLAIYNIFAKQAFHIEVGVKNKISNKQVISNCLRKKCTLVDHSKCKCRQIFVDCQGLAEWSGICAFCNNIFGIGLLSWFLIIFKKEDFNYLWSLPIKDVTDFFFLISPFT